MGIYTDLRKVKKLTNSSLGAIVENTNANFVHFNSAFLTFLNNLQYDETANNVTFNKITGKLFNITDTLTMFQNGSVTLTIDSQGRITGKSIIVEIAQAKRVRFTQFPDRPDSGTLGEVVYTGPNSPTLNEGLWLYTEYGGWVKLDGGSGGSNYLSQLLDVHFDNSPGPVAGDYLRFDASSNEWKNAASYELVTYSELTTLIGDSKLIPQQYYIITDYLTTGYFLNTDFYFEANTERLIVQAISQNQIGTDARSLDFTEDEIHYLVGPPPHSLLTSYDPCLYGATLNQLPPNFKGFISHRFDTNRNIKGPFDWRAWQYRLYSLDYQPWDSGTGYVPGDIVGYTTAIGKIRWLAIKPSMNIAPGSDSSKWMILCKDEAVCLSNTGANYDVAVSAPGLGIHVILQPAPNDFITTTAFAIDESYVPYSDITNVTFVENNIALLYTISDGDPTICTRIPHCILKSPSIAIWKDISVTGFTYIDATFAININIDGISFLNLLSTTYPPGSSILCGSIINVDLTVSSSILVTAPSIVNMSLQDSSNILVGIDSDDQFSDFKTDSGAVQIIIAGSTLRPGTNISIGTYSGDILLINSNAIHVKSKCRSIIAEDCFGITIGNRCDTVNLGSGVTSLVIGDDIDLLDLSVSTTVPGTLYDKTIFKNAALLARMSYYDITDSLVVLDPTL